MQKIFNYISDFFYRDKAFKGTKSITLLFIATNKYTMFLPRVIKSTKKYFLKKHDVKYIIFTDKVDEVSADYPDCTVVHIEHQEWPLVTLNRFDTFYKHRKLFENSDYVFYSDVDIEFIGHLSSEILDTLVATTHPCFEGGRGTPETNPKSLAYISSDEKFTYCCGAFFSGETTEVIKMSKILSDNIKVDSNNGIIALWHDESHMNRYFVDHHPAKIMPLGFLWPEPTVPHHEGVKLIALEKNHKDLRE